MIFTPGVIAPESVEGECIWFAFYKGKILMMHTDQGPALPQMERFALTGLSHHTPHYLGTIRDLHCFTVALKGEVVLPPSFYLEEFRNLIFNVESELFLVAGRARQVVEWDRNHQFCGRCGTQTVHHDRDRAKLCPSCGHTQYPRISPCIIVLITKGDEVLLARSPNFPPGVFSTIAGFVEPGETLEMAVHREIDEEVGVKVHNLRYMGSQPWPFPHSLMLGFFAEFKEGDIVLNDQEIEEADWWPLHRLPKIPPVGSISRNLIDSYLKQMGVTG